LTKKETLLNILTVFDGVGIVCFLLLCTVIFLTTIITLSEINPTRDIQYQLLLIIMLIGWLWFAIKICLKEFVKEKR